MRISKDAIITSAANIAASVIYIFTAFFATRILGPYHKGIYTLFISFCSILIIVSNLSLNSSASYFAAKYSSNTRRILRDLLKLSLTTSAIGIVISSIVFFFFRQTIFQGANSLFYIIAILTIPTGIFLTNSDNFLLGINKIKAYGFITLMKAVLNLFFILVFVILLKYQSVGAAVSYTVSILLSALLAIWLCYRNNRNNDNKSWAKQIISFGLKIHPTNLVAILEQRIDVILVGLMIGPSSVGLYSLATAFAETGLIIPNSLSSLIIPRTANGGSAPKKIIEFSLLFTIIYAVVVILICEYLIKTYFGSAFSDSTIPTKILTIAAIFFGLRKTLISLAFGRGSAKAPFVIMLFSLLINICLNIVLIPKYHIIGAALSSLITYALSMLMILLTIKFGRRLPFRK